MSSARNVQSPAPIKMSRAFSNNLKSSSQSPPKYSGAPMNSNWIQTWPSLNSTSPSSKLNTRSSYFPYIAGIHQDPNHYILQGSQSNRYESKAPQYFEDDAFSMDSYTLSSAMSSDDSTSTGSVSPPRNLRALPPHSAHSTSSIAGQDLRHNSMSDDDDFMSHAGGLRHVEGSLRQAALSSPTENDRDHRTFLNTELNARASGIPQDVYHDSHPEPGFYSGRLSSSPEAYDPRDFERGSPGSLASQLQSVPLPALSDDAFERHNLPPRRTSSPPDAHRRDSAFMPYYFPSTNQDQSTYLSQNAGSNLPLPPGLDQTFLPPMNSPSPPPRYLSPSPSEFSTASSGFGDLRILQAYSDVDTSESSEFADRAADFRRPRDPHAQERRVPSPGRSDPYTSTSPHNYTPARSYDRRQPIPPLATPLEGSSFQFPPVSGSYPIPSGSYAPVSASSSYSGPSVIPPIPLWGPERRSPPPPPPPTTTIPPIPLNMPTKKRDRRPSISSPPRGDKYGSVDSSSSYHQVAPDTSLRVSPPPERKHTPRAPPIVTSLSRHAELPHQAFPLPPRQTFPEPRQTFPESRQTFPEHRHAIPEQRHSVPEPPLPEPVSADPLVRRVRRDSLSVAHNRLDAAHQAVPKVVPASTPAVLPADIPAKEPEVRQVTPPRRNSVDDAQTLTLRPSSSTRNRRESNAHREETPRAGSLKALVKEERTRSGKRRHSDGEKMVLQIEQRKSLRWNDNLICPSPIFADQRRKGWFNRRGDQLWTNGGSYKTPEPGLEYPPDLDEYPEPGEGWMNEECVRIDMLHRLVPKVPKRSALKASCKVAKQIEA
ncbi:hypothetical protein CYLTODRAFT_492235 [Cylindrobasidium torrendii FP15055 ss-10]|uniref:Uncharacterized protein n=1 Tax=Cylindrobasidium torrendii FP15055 ss-10 TaxID=1314674 RepID=A0A0D7B4V0_9AGAR|nr:hypothetical protein CYLTODRAFT_492235 [Cylindrobasidium torrendii FP15055 ss-10]